MAPEQLLRVRSDKRSDLFALGAILYQMATGELPFGAPARIKNVRQRVWLRAGPPEGASSGSVARISGDHSQVPGADP